MARFVLVHGAFVGGWCWEPLLPLLEELGHDASAPDLPGSGADLTPVGDVTLDACAERLRDVLAATPAAAIVVGHGMGGMVITQAAALLPDRIARLVYLGAFLPRDGQSLLDLTQLPEGADDQVQANLTIEDRPAVGALTPKVLSHALFNRCTQRQLAWALERTRPQPLAPFLEPVRVGPNAFDPARRVYIRCARDHAIPPALQRRMADESPCAEIHELDSDHSPFLTATSQLARLLDRIAREPEPSDAAPGR
ncbi:MAG TPA: alpha/beta fold hydrolase [Solirubrobacteraceae bacterium]|nr:alpha/beta fold hydrolase [Solirubrobacteraceae bacterium]